ncbi:alpha/beta hydrolase [Agrobacterium pusense]|jgi:esterase/lipase superfamily enzyme|uniref:alpha/beta hydrolase n=1 Tax=Agrobacterium pusense TaxID=648995 RepID=UPI000684F557|nr:alpha/beta fold hydrolase [Agrobacterium pusense]MDH0872670.1 alpha/beta fold hydrolase [Agrobacterium pusense]
MPISLFVILSRSSGRLVFLALIASLSGCASRPSATVLEPVSIGQNMGQKVSLLAVTNRNKVEKDGGFGSNWAGNLTYERYDFSVPRERTVAAIRYPSSTPDTRRDFLVTGRDQLTEASWVEAAGRAATSDGSVALFVHGYNYRYQEALFRAAQMAADASTISPILFSWPSAASVTGYVTDRDAALYSRTELERVLTVLAKAPKVKRIILFGHSMGGFLSMEAVRQLKLEGRDDVLGKLQIVLAAPDIDVDVFRAQLLDIGRLKNPITLLVSKTDRALSVSSLVGGERPRVGLVDIADPQIRDAAIKANVSVIDISSVEASDGLGHDRYAALARFGGELEKAEARARNGGNVGAFVFDAAGAAVATPFRLAGQIARQ